LKQRILADVALEKQGNAAPISASRQLNWIPWAIAALFLVFCGMLALDRARLERQLAELRRIDPLARATLVTLASPKGELGDAKVIVAWQPDQQSGVITIQNLPLLEKGRDYQLWTIDADHKDPISAGLIHLDPNGTARIRFKPTQRADQVKGVCDQHRTRRWGDKTRRSNYPDRERVNSSVPPPASLRYSQSIQ
jgi:hypothetical protein